MDLLLGIGPIRQVGRDLISEGQPLVVESCRIIGGTGLTCREVVHR